MFLHHSPPAFLLVQTRSGISDTSVLQVGWEGVLVNRLPWSVLDPALAHLDKPVTAGRVERFPFTFMHSLASLELGYAGCKLSRSNCGSLAICPNIFSAELLGY